MAKPMKAKPHHHTHKSKKKMEKPMAAPAAEAPKS